MLKSINEEITCIFIFNFKKGNKMNFDLDELVNDFCAVAKLANIEINSDDIHIDCSLMPHIPPSKLPEGKMAVYIFSTKEVTLKVGKANRNSSGRYVSHHYYTKAPSTLAKSLLKDKIMKEKHSLTKDNITDWIKQNTDRFNLLIDADKYDKWTLSLLETFVQCRLHPIYEGHQESEKND